MAQTKEQTTKFLESIKLMCSLEESYKEKTTFEKKFSYFLNKDFEKILQYLEFEKDPYQTKKVKKYKEQALLVLNNEMFLKDIKRLAKKWNLDNYKYIISIVGFYENDIPTSINIWQNKLLAYTFKSFLKSKKHRRYYIVEFEKDINDLLYKYDFDNIWENSIIGFLLGGVLVLPIHYCRTIIEFDQYNNSPLLSIEITPNTTLEDIKQRWKDIEGIKNKIYPFRKKKGKTTENIQNIIKIKNDYNKRWKIVEEKYKNKEKRIKAIEALRKKEKRLNEKGNKIIKRGLYRKNSSPPNSIKDFEDMFGRTQESYYL